MIEQTNRENMTMQTNGDNRPSGGQMPVIFAAHGAPILLDDPVWMAELAAWARAMPRPESILMISAHWEARPTTLGATRTVPLVYDFYQFPERYYQVRYPAPGAPELAARVRDLLRRQKIAVADDPERGLDHGAYVPLVAMYPGADVPVLQVSMPALDAQELFRLGQAFAPLRDEGVLVFGSGFLTHNMRYAFRPGIPAWAKDFDAWVADALLRFDVDALLDFQTRAPAAATALPTWEHYAPVLVAAGAVGEQRPTTTFPISGFWLEGAFTKRSVQFD
jgi:4,5-DOPA dioxygenase extradiol